MSTLSEIEAAAEALPPEQKEELLRFLADRLRRQESKSPAQSILVHSQRGFPISRGRQEFTSADVARIESEAELDR
jgi:hypothetical protein